MKYLPGNHYVKAHAAIDSDVSIVAKENGYIVAIGSISKNIELLLRKRNVEITESKNKRAFVVNYKRFRAVRRLHKLELDSFIDAEDIAIEPL